MLMPLVANMAGEFKLIVAQSIKEVLRGGIR